jgi:hypothetical protein
MDDTKESAYIPGLKNSISIRGLGGLLEQGQDLKNACLSRAISSKESGEAAQTQVARVLP